MDDFFIYVIWIVVALLYFIRFIINKLFKVVDEEGSVKQVVEENFPKVNPLEQALETMMNKTKPAKKKQKKEKVIKKNYHDPIVAAQPVVKEEIKENKESIKLTNAQEARRAFIYSEIFNRKY